MLVKIYETMLALYAVAVLTIITTGNFTMFTSVVLGFIACALIFMGMLSVLPGTISHPSVPKPAKAETVGRRDNRETNAKGFQILKSA